MDTLDMYENFSLERVWPTKPYQMIVRAGYLRAGPPGVSVGLRVSVRFRIHTPHHLGVEMYHKETHKKKRKNFFQ